MGRDTKAILILFAFAIILVALYRYQQYVVQKNYTLFVATACDPETEDCFVMDCTDVDPLECDDTPYKKVEVLASVAPACLEEHTCEDFSCSSEEDCSVSYCSDDTLEEGEVCASEAEVPVETELEPEMVDEE